jgi:hypothetical protein
MCENIVGISKNPTICVPNESESKSGLYLDDTSKGRIPLKQAFWCDMDDLDRVIPEATEQVIKDLRVVIHKRLVKRFMNQKSFIGFKDDFTGGLQSVGNIKYICLMQKQIRGSVITLRDIKIYTEGGQIDKSLLKIYKGGTLLTDVTYPKFIQFDEPIFIAYDSASRPLNFKHTGCCGKEVTYQSYAYVGSGSFNADFDDNVEMASGLKWYNNDYSQGIYLDVEFDCDPLIDLCNTDFVRSPFGIVFAKLVQQTARLNIISYMLTNDKVTAYIDAKSEDLEIVTEYLNEDIKTMLNYLPENYSMSDCYTCNGIYKNEILI